MNQGEESRRTVEVQIDDRWREALASEESPESEFTSRSFFHRPRAAIGAPAGVVPAELIRRAGDELGEHLLLRLVGIGGMGQVWQARDLELGRTVALKVIRPDVMSDQMVDLFRREAKASSRLLHPNIVTVLGVGHEGDARWIVQEFVEGECTLATFLKEAQDEELPDDYDRRMALFFYQVADALVAAHRAGVVHRDVKPANIMILENGRPKLTDFGLARLRGEETAPGHPGLGGTPGFMSPEQADPTSPHDAGAPATDIFSLGATMYQALHFARPFGEGPPRDVVRRTLEESPPRPEQLRSSVHVDLAAVCAKALEKHPEDRYLDMRALRDDLANVLDGRPVSARATSPMQRATIWVRRNRRLVTGAVVGVALVVTLFWLGGELLGARREGRDSKVDLHLAQARRAVELGHVGEAVRELEAAVELAPEDPVPLVLLAGVHTQRSRYRLAEDALLRAQAAGYDPDRPVDDAQGAYLKGLYLMSVGRRPSYVEAEGCMTRAVGEDPELIAAWYPLYMLRTALGDHDGATAALRRQEDHLAVGDPYRSVLQSLRLREAWRKDREQHHLEEALRVLDAVDAELLGDPLDAHAFHRTRGMLLYELQEPVAAVEHLEAALELDPEDDDARLNLGLALTQSAQDLTGEERLLQLDRAVDLASRALEGRPWSEAGLRIHAHAEFQHVLEVGTLRDGSVPDPAERIPAILALEDQHPTSDLVPQLEAVLQFRWGNEAWDADENELARACFERCLEHRPEHFVARVLAAEACQFIEPADLDAAAAHYDEGYQLWVQREGAGPTDLAALRRHAEPEQWLRTLLVGRTSVAAQLGDRDRFLESRAALREVLAVHPFPGDLYGDAERLNYADALLIAEESELRSGDEAEALLDEFVQRWGEEPAGWPADLLPLVESVRSRLR